MRGVAHHLEDWEWHIHIDKGSTKYDAKMLEITVKTLDSQNHSFTCEDDVSIKKKFQVLEVRLSLSSFIDFFENSLLPAIWLRVSYF